MKTISIIGSTGSIGTQSLDIVRQRANTEDELKVIALSAGKNLKLLCEQIKEFKPSYVFIKDASSRTELKEMFTGLEVVDCLNSIAEIEVDIFVSAIVGIAGLEANLTALKNSKRVAVANKETLVAAGHLVNKFCRDYASELIPIDSEHVAIHQCLLAAEGSPRRSAPRDDVIASHPVIASAAKQSPSQHIKEIILTSSGGPFRTWEQNDFEKITLADALKHPTWTMGSKITIDSSTLVNKGLEVIEAHVLFDIPYEKIKVCVHPQSIVHSAVQFIDGNIIAQLGPADMRIPIQYAIDYPQRKEIKNQKDFSLSDFGRLDFEEPDLKKFPALALAYEAGKKGKSYPAVFNSANEVAVQEFLEQKIHYLDIARFIEKTLAEHQPIADASLEEILDIDKKLRNSDISTSLRASC